MVEFKKNVKRRALNDDERNIAETSVMIRAQEKRWLEYKIKYEELLLREGLELNYQNMRKSHEKDLKQLKNQLEEIDFILNTLHEQLNEGVIIKQPEKSKEVESIDTKQSKSRKTSKKRKKKGLKKVLDILSKKKEGEN